MYKRHTGQLSMFDDPQFFGSLLIKPAYKGMSDEDITREIAMNPYLQFFLGVFCQ